MSLGSSMAPTNTLRRLVQVASAPSGRSGMVRFARLLTSELLTECLNKFTEEMEHPEGNDVIGLQYGTNKHASQAGSGGFGTVRQIKPDGTSNLIKL